jgi:hypothetical protein
LVSFALIMVTLLGESTPFTMSRIQKTLHGVLEDHAQPGSGYSMNEPTPERSGGAEEGFGEARSPVFVANAPRGRPMSAGALPGGVNEQQSDSELKQKMAEPSAPAPVPLPPAMGSMPNDVLGSVVQDVSKGVSRLGNTPKRDSMAWEQGQGQVSVAGAQAGKGVPVWSSGIAVNVNFSSPSNTASVAKILLMPPWGVKLSGVLTLLSLWYLISVTALAAWAAYKNKLKKETSVTSNVDRDWVSGEQV